MTYRKNAFRAVPICLIMFFMSAISLMSTNKGIDSVNPEHPCADLFANSIRRVISDCPGKIGVALIVDNKDTVTVNNGASYPMMSVFKMHQTLAVCRNLDREVL